MLVPSLSYNQLKIALQVFGRIPAALADQEYETVRDRAEAECALQQKVLATREGLEAVVSEEAVQVALAALGKRYESPEDFVEDLAANHLDLASMARALEVELTVEAAMAQVAGRVEPPSAAQVAEALVAASHHQPEQRRLRHILITINDQFPENSRSAALARITKIRSKALAAGADFAALAQRYSECPSALQGGAIGPVARSGLYDSLADTLFAMAEGEISGVVESTMGFHVLRCEEVIGPGAEVSDQLRAKVSQGLHSRAMKRAVQAWLATL